MVCMWNVPRGSHGERLVTRRWCCLGGGGSGASLEEAGHREWGHKAREPAILPVHWGWTQPDWPVCSCCLCSSKAAVLSESWWTESPGTRAKTNLFLLELLLSGHFVRWYAYLFQTWPLSYQCGKHAQQTLRPISLWLSLSDPFLSPILFVPILGAETTMDSSAVITFEFPSFIWMLTYGWILFWFGSLNSA